MAKISEFRQKEVLDIATGKRLGYICDMEIDDASGRIISVTVSAPPFRFPCWFGTDVDSQENLIACRLNSTEEIAREIGADSLGYLSVSAAHRLADDFTGVFCDGCFTGKYPLPVSEHHAKNYFEQNRA